MTDDATTPNGSTADTPTDSEGNPLGYADCMAEIDAILAELEGADVDLDVLAARVRRASDLLRFCNQRLIDVRRDVDDVVTPMTSGQSVDGAE